MRLKNKSSWIILLLWVFLLLNFRAYCDTSEIALKLLRTLHAFSNRDSATFRFQVMASRNLPKIAPCKLDDGIHSSNGNGRVSYKRREDRNHSFEVCTNRSQGVGYASYVWIIG